MSYVEHKGLHLSDAQKKKLLKGEKVRVAHEHLAHPKGETAYLTKSQYKKLLKAHKEQKGMLLDMSQKQLKKHLKGSGLFSSIAKSLGRALIPIATDAVKGLANQGIDALAGTASNALGGSGIKKHPKKSTGNGILDLFDLFGSGINETKTKGKSKSGGSFTNVNRSVVVQP
jgi:hypothetical protein